MRVRIFSLLAVLVAGMVLPGGAWAQFQDGSQSTLLNLPLLSQAATASQRVGLTDITVAYHRPLVNGRKVWGDLVPYGQVWRAGANENTTIAFSDAVTVEGKPLAPGTYGLHMIPDQDHWTIIFSHNATSWGSFTYDPKEDALRVEVKPHAAEFQDALGYSFDDLHPDSTAVTLRWEKLAVPFTVHVDVAAEVAASLPAQMRGYAQYTYQGWADAATYLLESNGDLNQALDYADHSIGREERFDNVMLKSRILDGLHRADEAAAARTHAMALGTPLQINNYARGRQVSGHQAEAFAMFRYNIAQHPDLYFVHAEAARIASADHDFPAAIREMKQAVAGAPAASQAAYQRLLDLLQAGKDIN